MKECWDNPKRTYCCHFLHTFSAKEVPEYINDFKDIDYSYQQKNLVKFRTRLNSHWDTYHNHLVGVRRPAFFNEINRPWKKRTQLLKHMELEEKLQNAKKKFKTPTKRPPKAADEKKISAKKTKKSGGKKRKISVSGNLK